MKSFFKVLLIVFASLIIGSETNSCSMSMKYCEKKAKDATQTIQNVHEILEVNSWTLTSKFNF